MLFRSLTPTYHPTTREYTSTVYDQEKNFNVWALADYGINYRGLTSALEGAKLTMTAYKTRTAKADAFGKQPTDPDWVPTYDYSDPLKITQAYQAKAEMEYDPNTKLQLANETIASAAGATTVSTNRDALDAVYDQTDPQFGEKDSTTNPYVEKFWVEVTVEYEITVDGTTEHRVGTYIIEVTRDDKPVPSGLDDLRAYQRKLDQSQTPAVDDFNQLLPMYRLKDKDDRNTIVTDGVAGTTTQINVLDPASSTYAGTPATINKVLVDYEGTATTGFNKSYPYYMVIMDYTDSRLWPVIEFDTTKVSNVKMEVTTQIGVKQPDGTFVMQDVATPVSGVSNVTTNVKYPMDFGVQYYGNEFFQALIHYTVTALDGSTSEYYLLAVRGNRADEPGAQFSELHVWPGNTFADAESHKTGFPVQNQAKPIQRSEEHTSELQSLA